MDPSEFADQFAALTGNRPFPWQCRLYDLFREGQFPEACILPTGLGKTSVLAIWLLALATEPKKVPRRLVYVVNRRTVVDQSTDEAVKLRDNLGRVPAVRDSLAKMCAIPTEVPLAISTLRGQFADNGEWRNDPARPAIIAGTVDMIGSRLLFSGYNAGFKTRPLHAGLLGCGALLVHDEAHLEPAFQQTLNAIICEQHRSEPGSLRVMQLTATTRGGNGEPFRLSGEDRDHPEIGRRITATKGLHLHEVDDKAVTDELTNRALVHKDSGRAVLVFARTVEAVEKIAGKLGKQVETLTGTMRGSERDQLVTRPVFQRFLPGAKGGEGTCYLVCTSAGEVGVNISADHLVCDLSTFDSMAQRFGRVNRFGLGTDTRIDVVHPRAFKSEDRLDQRRELTLALLRELDGDVSPARIEGLDARRRSDAFSPDPEMPHATDILFDAWSMTTVRDALSGRPPVEDWLHGVAEWEQPRTQVAWREEVDTLDEHRGQIRPSDLLDEYELKPLELLSDRTDRVFKHLEKIADRLPDLPAWLMTEEGEVSRTTLGQIGRGEKESLEGLTVVLPPTAGGLREGMLDGGVPFSSQTRYDIADEWRDPDGRPWRIRSDGKEEDETLAPRLAALLPPPNKERQETRSPWRWDPVLTLWAESDDSSADASTPPKVRRWYVRVPRPRNQKQQTLGPHCESVGRFACEIATKLGFDGSFVRVVGCAGRGHDLGKNRPLWQRSIGNTDPTVVLAKSGDETKGPRWRTGYRHEFGSLNDVRALPEFAELSSDDQELTLHLIAAHHGRGRPHFPTDEAFDLRGDDEAARRLSVEVPRRFAALQRRCGRWRLALLESILRAADYLASKEGPG